MTEPKVSWEAAVQRLRADPARRELMLACYFDDPVDAAAERFRASTEWIETRRFLPGSPGLALEVGAGRGIASYALASGGWQVTALEPDPSIVVGAGAIRDLCARTGALIRIHGSSGEELPFSSERFDLVYCRAVLHHARDLRRMCAEASRVLRPGGSFVAVREHVLSSRADLPAFLAAHPLHALYGGENAYLLAEYRSAIASAGLRIEHCLGPFSSDINLFPDSRSVVRARIARRLRLPSSRLVPDLALRALDWFSDAPGRHYSFVARKPVQGRA
ncbi:MAG: class I SAM-dependent methyltransferase [Burkholderiales bacterium]